jgi:cation:H+ antiporter
MTLGLILLLFVFSFVLIKSADHVVVALRHLSRGSKSTGFILSALLIALATSFPELFVGITSALEGSPNLSLGNVMGSNVTNISLIAGLSAWVVGRVNVHGRFMKRDVAVALIAGVLPLILILDGQLGRTDGLILIATYGAYASSFFKHRFLQIAEEHKKGSYIQRFLRRFTQIDGNKTKEAARLFVGVAMLLISANIIVRIARVLAEAAGIPIFLVGLVLVSVGTTLPELAFSFRALEDKEPTMFFGNILGSIIANSTLVAGVAATISPITVAAKSEYMVAAAAFILIFLHFWFFIKSKLRLDRWEAAALLILYLAFVVVEFN